ncbi:MAG TPA: MFS transporter [Herpetosiphonaceae bacterium]|nr:MFS transporter [Herpetosiphonaceae bacterium]
MKTDQPAAGRDRVRFGRTLFFFASPLRRLLTIMALTALPFGTLELLLPLYVRVLGGSPSFIGLLTGLGAATVVLVRPLAGRLGDQGRVPLVVSSGAALLLLGMGCWALATDRSLLLAGRVAVSAGSACLGLGAQLLLAGLVAEAERGRGFGRLTAAGALGHVAGAGLAALVLIAWDSETQREVRAALLALNLQIPLPSPMGRIDATHALFGVYAGGMAAAWLLALARWPASAAQPGQSRRILGSWQRSWRRPAVRKVIGAGLLISVGYSMAVPMILPLFQDTFDAGLAGLAVAYAIPGVLYAAAPATLGRYADRWGRQRSARLGIWVSALVYMALPLLPSLMWTALVWSVEALSYSLYVPSILALLVDNASEDERGAAFSLYSVVAGCGAVIAAPLGGWLYQYVAPPAPFLLAAGALIGAGVFLRGQPT